MNHTAIPRRSSLTVQVGQLTIGGTAPIRVQSMTNTDTADISATTAQIIELVRAGSELVRLTVNHETAAAAVPRIRDALAAHFGVSRSRVRLVSGAASRRKIFELIP